MFGQFPSWVIEMKYAVQCPPLLLESQGPWTMHIFIRFLISFTLNVNYIISLYATAAAVSID